MLRDLDVHKIREFCFHHLARKIFEYGQDNGPTAEIFRKIMLSCNRKGMPLNTRSGFQQAFVGRGTSEVIGVARFKSILRDITPSLSDSELIILENQFKTEPGKLNLKRFIDELFNSVAKKKSPTNSYAKSKTIAGPGADTMKALKGKMEEVKKENDMLKRENSAMSEKIAKLEKAAASAKISLPKASDKEGRAIPTDLREASTRVLTLEKANYKLMEEIDTELKPAIARYKSDIEKLKSEMKFLKLENLKSQTKLEKLLKKPLDAVEKQHELDYIKDNKLAEQEKKINELLKELSKAEEKTFTLDQFNQKLKYEKENFDLERSRLENRIKDLERFLAETK